MNREPFLEDSDLGPLPPYPPFRWRGPVTHPEMAIGAYRQTLPPPQFAEPPRAPWKPKAPRKSSRHQWVLCILCGDRYRARLPVGPHACVSVAFAPRSAFDPERAYADAGAPHPHDRAKARTIHRPEQLLLPEPGVALARALGACGFGGRGRP